MIVKQTKNEAVKDEKKDAKTASKVVRAVTHSFPRPLFSAKS